MKILFLAANPQSTSRLNLAEEVREIEEGLKRSKLSNQFQLVQRWEVRPRDLRRALLEENPDIVHFSGHGTGEAGLVLVDNRGNSQPATKEALAGLFTQFPKIKCVLLNACYAEVQAKAVVKHIDYVIGMRDTILDDAAIAFTTGFYDGLGYGRTIEDAFELGKNAILWELSSFSGTTRQGIPVDLANTESVASLPEHLKPILLKKANNISQTIANQPQTSEKPIIDKHRQTYQQRIQDYLKDRPLTPIAKFQLATLAKQLDISEAEANQLLQTELQKIEEANQLLQTELQKIEEAKANYQAVLKQTIEEGHDPFNSTIQQQLKNLQADLKLKDSEVAEISQAILQEAEIKIRSQIFTFQVVTVDETGKENNRTTKEAELFTENLGDDVTLEMVKIPSGIFWMGTEEKEIERLCQIYNTNWFRREAPQHRVNVPSFYMGRYPITQAQWRIVAGWESIERNLEPDPSYFKEDYEGKNRWTKPVKSISWDDAVEFCARLSQKTKREYRLPTEAEWEYACRSVSHQLIVNNSQLSLKEWNEQYNQPFHFGENISTELANYRGIDWEYKGRVYPGNYGNGSKGIYRQQATPVKYFSVANAFGLSDMHGNVWEWCMDDWHDNYNNSPSNGSAWLSTKSNKKVIRGGSWVSFPDSCRSAYRNDDSRESRFCDIGFRVVCVAPRTT